MFFPKKQHRLLTWLSLTSALLVIMLTLQAPTTARQKDQSKKLAKSQFRYAAVHLGQILAKQTPLQATREIFVQAKDLRQLGLKESQLKHIRPQMQKKYQQFLKRIREYRKAGARPHTLTRIELSDVEYLKKWTKTEVIALKNVLLYYKRYSEDMTQRRAIKITVPAFLLLNGEWKVTELFSIKRMKSKHKKK